MTRVARVASVEPSFGPAHLGLGMTATLAAHCEDAVGRWPSLVVETGALSVQIDLHPNLTASQARAVVAKLAAAVAEWEHTVTGAVS